MSNNHRDLTSPTLDLASRKTLSLLPLQVLTLYLLLWIFQSYYRNYSKVVGCPSLMASLKRFQKLAGCLMILE